MPTSAKDADGGWVVVGVVPDAADDDLEGRSGDVDAVELGVQVVHTLLLRHEPKRRKVVYMVIYEIGYLGFRMGISARQQRGIP